VGIGRVGLFEPERGSVCGCMGDVIVIFFLMIRLPPSLRFCPWTDPFGYDAACLFGTFVAAGFGSCGWFGYFRALFCGHVLGLDFCSSCLHYLLWCFFFGLIPLLLHSDWTGCFSQSVVRRVITINFVYMNLEMIRCML
jgi:hypothetical protein